MDIKEINIEDILDQVIEEEYIFVPKRARTDFQSQRECPTRTTCLNAMRMVSSAYMKAFSKMVEDDTKKLKFLLDEEQIKG